MHTHTHHIWHTVDGSWYWIFVCPMNRMSATGNACYLLCCCFRIIRSWDWNASWNNRFRTFETPLVRHLQYPYSKMIQSSLFFLFHTSIWSVFEYIGALALYMLLSCLFDMSFFHFFNSLAVPFAFRHLFNCWSEFLINNVYTNYHFGIWCALVAWMLYVLKLRLHLLHQNTHTDNGILPSIWYDRMSISISTSELFTFTISNFAVAWFFSSHIIFFT